MIKVIVCGACGKMGNRLINLIGEDKEMKIIEAIEEKSHPRIDKTIIGDITVTDNLEKNIDATDVVIDFTNPGASLRHLEIAEKHQKAIVIGTTGFKDGEIYVIKTRAEKIPCVLAPNMSLGVNLLFKLAREIAKALPSYNPEIIEVHHNQKKDAPSGTAYKLAEEISLGYADANPATAKNRILSHGRSGTLGLRKPEEIGIHAVRAGDIVGEHTVIFAGPGERIELTHRAHSRDVFVYGAIKAAKWIVGKPAGLYDMRDVSGIK